MIRVLVGKKIRQTHTGLERLTELEIEQMSTFGETGDAELFYTGRVMLRTILGEEFECSPREVALRATAFGVSAVRRERLSIDGNMMSVSLAASGNLVVFACSDSGNVGVDLQWLRADDASPFAEGSEIPESWWGSDVTVRQQLRREAVMKVLGNDDSAVPAEDTRDGVEAASVPDFLEANENDHNTSKVKIVDLDLGVNYAGALAFLDSSGHDSSDGELEYTIEHAGVELLYSLGA